MYIERTPLSLPLLDTIKHDPSLVGDGKWPFEQASPGRNTTTKLLDLSSAEDVTNLPCYQMKSSPRGIGVIVNNRDFCTGNNRVGTDNDADALQRLFAHLGFYTNRYDNLTGSQMRCTLKEAADIDHKKFDCLLIAILTHGSEGKLYGVDNESVPVKDLTQLFNGDQCPSLIGKPKIFFIQACRGQNVDGGVKYDMKDGGDGKKKYLKASEEQLDSIKSKVYEEVEETDTGYTGLFMVFCIIIP